MKSDAVTLWVLVLPDMLMLDMVGPCEVFNVANRYKPESFELRFFGPSSPVTTGMGLSINIEARPESIPAGSWLLVPGLQGLELDFSSPQMQGVLDWLRCNDSFEKVISVCSGALLLGHAGMLQGRVCTTHHSHLEELAQLFPTAQVKDNRLFVRDGNVYTSAGVTAGIDLALHMVEQHCGAQCAASIARNLVLFTRRGGREPASSVWLSCRNHLDRKVHKVQDAIQAEPARAWRLNELSDLAGCTPRHLTRLFKARSGVSITQYLHKLRISLAAQLLQQSDLSVVQVAHKVGFDDVRQFHRVWKREWDVAPSHLRERKSVKVECEKAPKTAPILMKHHRKIERVLKSDVTRIFGKGGDGA